MNTRGWIGITQSARKPRTLVAVASPTEVYPAPVWVGAPLRPGTDKRYEDAYTVTVRDPREYPFADNPVYAVFAEVGEDTKMV